MCARCVLSLKKESSLLEGTWGALMPPAAPHHLALSSGAQLCPLGLGSISVGLHSRRTASHWCRFGERSGLGGSWTELLGTGLSWGGSTRGSTYEQGGMGQQGETEASGVLGLDDPSELSHMETGAL